MKNSKPMGLLQLDARQTADELADVVAAGLEEVVENEYRSGDVLLDVLDVANEQLRIAERDLLAPVVLAERVRRATAGHAVVRASSAGERGAHRILQPVAERAPSP